HLPVTDFVFLSAYHTAEVTEGRIIDEGLHLAAAVQYCGLRSVVMNMWVIVDEDGYGTILQSVALRFEQPEGVPCCERSAKALRFAVKKLRKKRRITPER
ncbi:hypothetical protein EDB87DRAFT_1549531, partial [Lactarius vividus]